MLALLYKPDEQKIIKSIAENLMKDWKVKCSRGGCDAHYEPCNVDAAWDAALMQAEIEFDKINETKP